MTCFWDGILRNINQEDFNLSDSGDSGNVIQFKPKGTMH